MTPTDWSSDHNIPATVSAPDLFGGELFGDELMDMYNSDAVVGTSGDVATDISNLLSSTHGDHDGVRTATPDEGLSDSFDDGLGAFRPSTSFNDLTSLLPEAPPSVVSSNDSIMAAVPIEEPSEAGQKRSIGVSNVTEPAQKKRATVVKARAVAPDNARRPTVKPTQAPTSNSAIPNSSAGQAALKLRKEQQAMLQGGRSVNNTPNPLSELPAAPGVKKAMKPVVAPTTGSIPAVVSPRATPSAKADSITSEAAAATAAAAAVAAAVSVPVPPPAPLSCATTEADFKSVAQAAVTNLILNAGATKGDAIKAPTTDNTKVDTSTAHIKALTSSNWVAACSGGSAAASAAAAAVAADSKANRVRRQNLTPDERARQNRDRNREHARNTRLRKKAYVEELKRTLTELVAQRDAAELEKRHSSQRELEQREVRFRVMEEFLKLRGRNEASFARWAAILEESFALILPVTDYRKMVEQEEKASSKTEQVLHGASEAMGDAVHLASFLQTLGNGIDGGSQKAPVTLTYKCDRKSFFMDGCNGVLVWTATTVGAVGEGAPMELTLNGNMRAKFSPASNKLVSAEIMFDTGNIAAQLQLLDTPKAESNHTQHMNCDTVAAAAAAAQAAANEADALLDSLQMPQLGNAVPSAIVMVSSVMETTAVSVSDKDDSSDEGLGDNNMKSTHLDDPEFGVTTRRSTRRKD